MKTAHGRILAVEGIFVGRAEEPVIIQRQSCEAATQEGLKVAANIGSTLKFLKE